MAKRNCSIPGCASTPSHLDLLRERDKAFEDSERRLTPVEMHRKLFQRRASTPVQENEK